MTRAFISAVSFGRQILRFSLDAAAVRIQRDAMAPAARTAERKIASPPYLSDSGAFIPVAGSFSKLRRNIPFIEFLQVFFQSGAKLSFAHVFPKDAQLFSVIPDLNR